MSSYHAAPNGATTPVVPGAFSQALSTPVQTYNMTSPAPELQTRPEKTDRGCRDVLFSILFYLHLAGVMYAAVVYAPLAAQEAAGDYGGERRLGMIMLPNSVSSRWLQDEGEEQGGYNNENGEIEINPGALLGVLVIAGILSFIFASLALGFMMRHAEMLVKIALWFNIILFAVMGILSLLGGVIPTGLIFLGLAAFSAYYAYRVWSRIPFAASNLVTAVSAVRANLGLSLYAYWSVVVLFLWSIVWMISASSTIYVMSNCNAEGECDDINGGLIFLFMVSYYWTAQGKRTLAERCRNDWLTRLTRVIPSCFLCSH